MSGLASIGPRDIESGSEGPTDEDPALKARRTERLLSRGAQYSDRIGNRSQAPPNKTFRPARRSMPNSGVCEPDAGRSSPTPVQTRERLCQDPKNEAGISLCAGRRPAFPHRQDYRSSKNNAVGGSRILSASATYVVSLHDPSGKPVKFSVISVDGVATGVSQRRSRLRAIAPMRLN